MQFQFDNRANPAQFNDGPTTHMLILAQHPVVGLELLNQPHSFPELPQQSQDLASLARRLAHGRCSDLPYFALCPHRPPRDGTEIATKTPIISAISWLRPTPIPPIMPPPMTGWFWTLLAFPGSRESS